MAVSLTNLISGQDTDGNSTAVTASISPASNNLILLCVSSRTNVSVDPNIPTVTGNGLTWVQIATVLFDSTSASRRRVTLFRAMGSSPSSGAATIDFGGQNQTTINYSVDQASGIDTSGSDGSGAIVQSATNTNDGSAGDTTFTITLGTFGSADNGTYGGFGYDGDVSNPTVGSGFTLLARNFNSDLASITEWNATNDTSVDATASGPSIWGGIAIEIKASGGGATSSISTYKTLLGVGTL